MNRFKCCQRRILVPMTLRSASVDCQKRRTNVVCGERLVFRIVNGHSPAQINERRSSGVIVCKVGPGKGQGEEEVTLPPRARDKKRAGQMGDYYNSRQTTECCLRNPQAVLVYDVANRASFEELEQWLAEAADFGAGGIPMAVCANKVRNPSIPSDSRSFIASYY